MGILPGRQKDPVGLSFEGNLVKYAELEPIGGGRMRVAGWGARSFSVGAEPETVQASEEHEAHAEPVIPLQETDAASSNPLMQPWTMGVLRKLKRKPVYASFADGDVLVKFITLPELTEQEVARMIELRHREYLPLPNAQIVYDFSIVRFTQGGNKKEARAKGTGTGDTELRVMVSGAERGTYLMYREAIAQEGVVLRSLETNQVAITRACNFLLGPEDAGTYAMLYLSETYSIVNFVVDHGLYYSRLLEQGLEVLTPDEAGNRRAERLLRELYRSVDFFSVESRGIPIDTLFLVNGGAEPDAGITRRMQQFLAERLAVEVQTIGEACRESDLLAVPQGASTGTVLLPVGLALRATGEGGA